MKSNSFQKLNGDFRKQHNKKRYYKRFFNIYAHSSVPWQQVIIKRFTHQIALDKNERVLDVGAGIGNNVVTLKQYFNQIVASDISDEALYELQKQYACEEVDLQVVVADVESLPFKDSTFDLVVCTEVFEHCIDFKKAFGECLRVLRPGGYIIVSSPNYFNPAGIVKWLFEKIFRRTWDAWGNHEGGIENNITSFGLLSLMRSSNVTILATQGGDCMRSWLPFLKRYYNFIDKHPCLAIGQLPVIKMLLMNFFILGVKPTSRQ